MLPISPTELAQLLRISPGPDGTASIVAEDSLKEALQRFSSFLVFRNDAPRQPRESHTEEFWSQYFPSFLRSMLVEGEHQAYFLRMFQWMRSSSRTSLDRFIRENPQDACEVYLFEAHMLALQVERYNTLLVKENGVDNLIRSASHFLISLVGLVPQIPTSVPMPCLPPRSTAGILAVASVFKEDPRFSRSVLWTGDQCREVIHKLLLLASVSDVREQKSVWRRTSTSVVPMGRWWRCESARRATAPSECVKMEEGEQMKACARCIAVRYCSREHQRADWKRHKLVCFKPSW